MPNINIGGIFFNSENVITQSKRPVNSNLDQPIFEYKVETDFGTFIYTENTSQKSESTQDVYLSENEKPTIYKDMFNDVVIKNCQLTSIKGTEKEDSYMIENGHVQNIDISGDPQNEDSVGFLNDDNCDLTNITKDDNDIVENWGSMRDK